MSRHRFGCAAFSGLLAIVWSGYALAESEATINVNVLKEGVAENQGIRLSPNKVSVASGDLIKILVDSALFCPGGGATSGKIKTSVPVNSCGFAAGDQTITEGDADLTKTLGPANAGVTSFNITVNYSDVDCNDTTGPATQTLCVDCNGGLKKHCTYVPLNAKDLVCTPDVTFCDCAALGGVWNDVCVPTVSEWGLLVLTMLVLTAGTVVVMRRRAAATT